METVGRHPMTLHRGIAAAAMATLPAVLVLSFSVVARADKPPELQYGNCPDPAAFCAATHPGTVPAGMCGYEECFDMNYGEYLRLMPLQNQGPFPKTWKVWHSRVPDSSAYGALGCQLQRSGNKTLVTIPPMWILHDARQTCTWTAGFSLNIFQVFQPLAVVRGWNARCHLRPPRRNHNVVV